MTAANIDDPTTPSTPRIRITLIPVVQVRGSRDTALNLDLLCIVLLLVRLFIELDEFTNT